MNDPVNWQAVAAEYRHRLHSICTIAAIASYAGLCLGIGKLLDGMHLGNVWNETIAMLIWFPMGMVAWYIKNRLEDWADRGLPAP